MFSASRSRRRRRSRSHPTSIRRSPGCPGGRRRTNASAGPTATPSSCSVRTLAKPLVVAVVTLQAAVAGAADDLSIDVDRDGRSFAVHAEAIVAAPAATVWEVLTDYDNLAHFIPGLSRSTVQLR